MAGVVYKPNMSEFDKKLAKSSQGGCDRGTISMSFAVSDSYSQHLAVVLTSILFHNPESDFVFHVLHRDITPENQSRVKELESFGVVVENSSSSRVDVLPPFSNSNSNSKLQLSRNRIVSIRFHKIDESLFEKFPIPPELEHVTQEMYYRYVLPDILADEDRTIYSDVDVLCVGDLRPLWETDLEGNVTAAVSEGERGEFKKELIGLSGPSPYFYSGLLVMDLAKMRAEGAAKALFETTMRYADRMAWPDQDAINLAFRDRILQLGPEWDGINVRYSPFRRGIAIWHFPGFTMKPWCNIWKNTTWPIYLKYLLKSPYRANAARFVWGHVKGFFYFKYTKKRVTRYLVCGIRVWKRREAA